MAGRQSRSSVFATIRYNQFKTGDEIGKGRFKRVCKGSLRHPEDGSQRDVVVLRYPKSGDQKEMDILKLLSRTPGSAQFVPEVYGSCEERPEYFILQERALLGSLKMALAEGCETKEIFSPMHRIYAASQMCRAMEFLESVRIAHADMSCRNCLLFHLDEEEPSEVLVKVTDFGLAVVVPAEEGAVFKKQSQAVRWCAPETIAHAKLSPRADTWSLGITLWELFSGGTNPWPHREKRAEVSAILRGLGEGGVENGPDAVDEALEALATAPSAEPPAPFRGIAYEFPQPHDCPQAVHEIMLSAMRVPEDSSAGRQRRSTACELAKAFERIIEIIMGVEPPRAPDSTGNGPVLREQIQQWVTRPTRRVAHSAAVACPDSISRMTSNAAVSEFTDWATTRWGLLHEMFVQDGCDRGGKAYPDAGGMTRERWMLLLRNKGYKGDASTIFDEIASEVVGGDAARRARALSAAANAGVDVDEETTISLPQLKRFEARAMAASSSVAAGEETSAASRFAKYLKTRRGTVLRAWRTEIDLRGTGKVAYVDFTNACRKLGVSGQARLVWDCLRQEGRAAPLEFHEVAPEEADNIEQLSECLLKAHGFDLEKAWQCMDENNQNYLTLQDFAASAERLGFEGNAKLIFKGLDSSGLGRMLQEDFEYLGKISGKAPYGRQPQHSPVAELISHVKREGCGADEFLSKIGVVTGQQDIAVNDLAARLTALGFPGDALQAASRAARSSGGSRVSVEVLRSLLSGERFKDTCSEAPSSVTWGTARLSPSRFRPPPRPLPAWDNGVDDLSKKNLAKCNSSREFFSKPTRDSNSSVGSGYRRA